MTKFAAILAVSVLSMTYATGVLASEIQMKVMTNDNQATVSLTQDGQALANYPVQIQGEKHFTSEQGTITVTNYRNHSRTIKFVALDTEGNTIAKQAFVSRDRE